MKILIVAVDSISGDSISGDSISGDSISGESISGDFISGDFYFFYNYCIPRRFMLLGWSFFAELFL